MDGWMDELKANAVDAIFDGRTDRPSGKKWRVVTTSTTAEGSTPAASDTRFRHLKIQYN